MRSRLQRSREEGSTCLRLLVCEKKVVLVYACSLEGGPPRSRPQRSQEEGSACLRLLVCKKKVVLVYACSLKRGSLRSRPPKSQEEGSACLRLLVGECYENRTAEVVGDETAEADDHRG